VLALPVQLTVATTQDPLRLRVCLKMKMAHKNFDTKDPPVRNCVTHLEYDQKLGAQGKLFRYHCTGSFVTTALVVSWLQLQNGTHHKISSYFLFHFLPYGLFKTSASYP
jgi:hypothetical protein